MKLLWQLCSALFQGSLLLLWAENGFCHLRAHWHDWIDAHIIFLVWFYLSQVPICFKVCSFLHSLMKKSVFMSSSSAPKKDLSFYYPIIAFCIIFFECSSWGSQISVEVYLGDVPVFIWLWPYVPKVKRWRGAEYEEYCGFFPFFTIWNSRTWLFCSVELFSSQYLYSCSKVLEGIFSAQGFWSNVSQTLCLAGSFCHNVGMQ